MKPIIKLNLALIIPFIITASVTAWFHSQLIERNAFRQVTDQAELLLEQMNALRSYTVSEVRPLTELVDQGSNDFHPQSVPAYAATQVSSIFSQSRPEYSYKEAVFNPTNMRDNAAPWEERLINKFIDDDSNDKLIGIRRVDGVRSLYISKPIKISNPACLECHSTPSAAPASMIEKYGSDNGFNWKLNEIVGIQLLLVPYTLPAELANNTFKSFALSIGLIFLVSLLGLNLMLFSIGRKDKHKR